MRALTLRPWWAYAVSHLGKRIENRSRPIPPAMIGQRIAIHAGAAPASGAAYEADEDLWRAYAVDALSLDSIARVAPRRCIVATAVLAGHEDRDEWEHKDWPWSRRPPWAIPEAAHWWRLADVTTLADPVPVARGRLGLWRLDDATVAAVRLLS